MRSYPEQALQVAVADYLRLVLPPTVFWSAVGHGGGGRVRGAILKAMGLRAGVPDLFLIHGGRAYFIELKTPTGRISTAQMVAHDAIERAGATVAICRSVDAVADQLRRWVIKTREVSYGHTR